MSFEQQSTSDVLARLKADLASQTNNQVASVEGSFNADMLTANSIEFGNAYNEMNLMIDAAFAQTAWDNYLTMRAAEFGVIRKEATNALVDLTITGAAGAVV
ncbi:baseplate J/gp47 family protein [Pectinatus frisingensis]|uniref:baseplate J/gp47 family protein n=1 Tax=Pectinatus frisingensis TaxID=865 RepID=UPI0018C643A4|nr:baseplate J/gp47 family protein [Pectinatus frisingensis]